MIISSWSDNSRYRYNMDPMDQPGEDQGKQIGWNQFQREDQELKVKLGVHSKRNFGQALWQRLLSRRSKERLL